MFIESFEGPCEVDKVFKNYYTLLIVTIVLYYLRLGLALHNHDLPGQVSDDDAGLRQATVSLLARFFYFRRPLMPKVCRVFSPIWYASRDSPFTIAI